MIVDILIFLTGGLFFLILNKEVDRYYRDKGVSQDIYLSAQKSSNDKTSSPERKGGRVRSANGKEYRRVV